MKKTTSKHLSELNEGNKWQFSRTRLYDDIFLKNLIADIMEPTELNMDEYKMNFVKGNSLLITAQFAKSN